MIIAAELTGVGLKALSQPVPPGHSLPDWLIAVAWIPFTIGLALAFNARMRDVPWMLLLVYLAWGVQELVLAHSLVVPQEGETGATGAAFIAAAALAFAAGVLEQFRNLPPRGVTILAGFFALTVGAVALRGLTLLAGNPPRPGVQRHQGRDRRDSRADRWADYRSCSRRRHRRIPPTRQASVTIPGRALDPSRTTNSAPGASSASKHMQPRWPAAAGDSGTAN